ncbi:MAG: hypothetical protein EBY85_06635, partial [Burkholderiaceae bacterium]|nr:hypothetical protein [Burkholderiaceae bacterium]
FEVGAVAKPKNNSHRNDGQEGGEQNHLLPRPRAVPTDLSFGQEVSENRHFMTPWGNFFGSLRDTQGVPQTKLQCNF